LSGEGETTGRTVLRARKSMMTICGGVEQGTVRFLSNLSLVAIAFCARRWISLAAAAPAFESPTSESCFPTASASCGKWTSPPRWPHTCNVARASSRTRQRPSRCRLRPWRRSDVRLLCTLHGDESRTALVTVTKDMPGAQVAGLACDALGVVRSSGATVSLVKGGKMFPVTTAALLNPDDEVVLSA
jgi:hypothetical protein